MFRFFRFSFLFLFVAMFSLPTLSAGASPQSSITTTLPAMNETLEREAPVSMPLVTDPDLRSGWPVDLSSPGAGFPYTATLFDADGDGADEIFVTGGHTFGLRGDGTFLPGWPTTEMLNMGYGTNGSKPGPTIANLDNDGDCEILWSLRDWYAGSSYMWSFNGKNFDGSNLPGFPQVAPDGSSNALDIPFVAGDTDGDGDLEIWGSHTIGNTFIYDRLSGFDHEGTCLFTVGLGADESALSLHFGDVDGNGVKEMFVLAWDDPSLRLHVFQADGQLAAGYPRVLYTFTSGYLPFGSPIPFDLDSDGDLEILYGYTAGSSFAICVHHDGTPCNGFPITIASSSQLFYLGLGDVTGDAVPELLATDNHLGSDYRVHVIDIATGTPLPAWPMAVPDWPKSFPTIVDITDDGLQEICFVDDGGKLNAVRGNGMVVPGYPKQMISGSISGVAAGDIDGDGLYELVTSTWDGYVYAWETEGTVLPGRADWPMRGIDPWNTGVFATVDYADVVDHGGITMPLKLSASPNPVQASASISFNLDVSSRAQAVDIFDPSGRKVASLSGGAGSSLSWSPSAEDAAGIYLARAVGGSREESVRFVVLR